MVDTRTEQYLLDIRDQWERASLEDRNRMSNCLEFLAKWDKLEEMYMSFDIFKLLLESPRYIFLDNLKD